MSCLRSPHCCWWVLEVLPRAHL
uniref:Uncharacterized protein n=1 Tax=Arundo donax TaxID=35708 RepID=A0A0A8ZUY6_ARUDO